MISVSCSCGRKFKADDHHAGKRTKCPVCGNVLTIGPAPVTPASGEYDNGQVPSWWFPAENPARSPTQQPPRPPAAQPRSGSNPDDIQTAVIAATSGQSASTSGSEDRIGTSSTPFPVFGVGNLKLVLGLMAGTLLLCLIGLGLVIWLQTTAQRGPAAAPGQPLPAANQAGNGQPDADSRPPRPGDQTPGPVTDTIPATASQATVPHELTAVTSVRNRPAVAAAASVPALRLIVPAYFYPAGPGLIAWQRVIEAGPRINIVAIANPNTGPGKERNNDYSLIFQAAREKGIAVVGYVSTDYAKRMLPDVKAEINRWVEFYPQIQGFFFDQQSTSPSQLSFYMAVRDHARSKIKDALVIDNPGTVCDPSYFSERAADVTCIFASYEGFGQFSPPASLWQFEPARFAALCYQIPDAAAMRQIVHEAMLKHIGYLYISDAPRGSNPWRSFRHTGKTRCTPPPRRSSPDGPRDAPRVILFGHGVLLACHVQRLQAASQSLTRCQGV